MSRASENPTVQAYAELQAAFDHYNERLFDAKLPPCLITMQREKHTYGYFSSKRFAHRGNRQMTDEIAMNPCYFGVVPLLEILQTMVHEMAHAWQCHFGKPSRRSYHNKEWADKMESIGLMPSSTGAPGGARTGEKMADYPIPGGRFMQATDELLATGFQVSWLDRYPPQRIVAIATGTATAAAAAAVTMPAAADEAESILLATDQGVRDRLELAPLLEPQAGNRSNRVKYRCPGCGAQVWGKPSLRVLCGGEECHAVEFDAIGAE